MKIELRVDRMTRNERAIAVFSRQPTDRVPFYALSFSFSAVNVGYKIADWYSDPKKCFDACMRTAEQYGWMDFPFIGYASFGAWEFGGKVKMPDGEFAQAPTIVENPATSEDDVWNLKVPDVRTAGMLPLCTEVYKIAKESGEAFNKVSMIQGIFTAAANICGVEQFTRWMIKKPELVHRLMRLSTDLCVEWVRYNAQMFGAKRIVAVEGEPTASNQVISPKQFEEFALPYIKEAHEKILSMGVKHIFSHICAEQNRNLKYWAQIPMGDPGVISVGHEIDLEVLKDYFPNDIILGNIEPAVIQFGTPEQVYELTRICIEKGRKHLGGFILGAGCEFPPLTPKDNVWAIMQAISDFGWNE